MDLGGDAFLQGLDVADDAHAAAAQVVEVVEGFHHVGQVVGAQGAESLVDEDGVHREHLARHPGQCQCQRQRHHEALAARQRGHRCLVALQQVAHEDGERTGLGFQFIAVVETVQVLVGDGQQFLEDVAEGDFAEFRAVGIAQHLVEL